MRRHFSGLVTLAAFILMAGLLPSVSAGQSEPKPKRLQAPATIHGLVGGESHNAYVVRVRKGHTLKIEISWRTEDGNTASFGVGSSPDFEPVQFGQESQEGRKWIGKVPKTGDYFIEVDGPPAGALRAESYR